MMIGLVVLVSIFMLGLMIMAWQISLNITGKLDALSTFGQTGLMAKDICYHTVQVQQFLTDASLTHDRSGLNEARNHFEAAQELLNRLMDLAPNDETHIHSITKDLKEMQQIGEKMADTYITQGVEAGNILMKGSDINFDHLSLQVQEEVNRFVKNLGENMKQQGHDLSSNGKLLIIKATKIQIFSFMIVLASSLLALFMIRGRIKEILVTLNEAFSNLSTGNLAFRLQSESKGEMEKISIIFNNFVEQFEMAIRQFININDQISSFTAENYINAHDTAAGVNRQSQQIDAMATAMTQINSTITYLANNTISASKAAREMANLIQRGSADIVVSIDNMHQIKSRSEASAKILEVLGNRSNEISKIAEVIKDIAAQTNLLALNAAIEAARAGEQGRGFSVVADEVRQLAEKTTQATGRITEMVKGVQEETQRSVSSMKVVADGVAQGMTLIQGTGNILQEMASHGESVANRMMDISATTEQQSTTTQHLSKNIDEIAKVARNIASRAQQDATLADTLATSVVGELETIVQRYQLEQEESSLDGAELEQALESVPPIFKWEDDLSVGISRIDDQHKVLIALINRLNAAMKKRMSTVVTGEILNELLDYTKTHFSVEEEIFKRYRYAEPEYSKHLKAHAFFIKNIEEVQQKFKRGDRTVGIKILNFLRHWLIEHIKETDKKYVPFFLQNGVK
ncbi:hemerythrin [Gammaproteobacteria bacterium]